MFRHNSNELRGKGKTLQVSTKEAKYLKKGDIKPASVHPSELSFLLLGGTIVVESVELSNDVRRGELCLEERGSHSFTPLNARI